MILWVVGIAILALWPTTTSIKYYGYHLDYLEPERTLAIKGIFVMLIFASHFVGYVELSPSILNTAYTQFRIYMGQLVVAPFLFYSGYGITVQVQRRGEQYVRDFPRNRIRRVFLQFWLALLLFFIVGCIQGTRFTAKQLLLSLVGWTSLGNSNWYVLMIICLYVISYAAFRITRKTLPVLLLVWAGCVAYSLWQKAYGRPTYCYNTVFAYWIGMFYAYYKEDIDRSIVKKEGTYLAVVLVMLVLFIGLHRIWKIRTLVYDMVSVCFALLLVLLSSHIQINNPLLTFIGRHVFSMYILQRLPMIVLQGTLGRTPGLYFCLTFVLTILLSILFDRLSKNLYKTHRLH